MTTTLVVADGGGTAVTVAMSLPILVCRGSVMYVKGIRYSSKKRADEGTSFRKYKRDSFERMSMVRWGGAPLRNQFLSVGSKRIDRRYPCCAK